jgi:hypothetical protein
MEKEGLLSKMLAMERKQTSPLGRACLTLGLALMATVVLLVVMRSTPKVHSRVLEPDLATVYVEPAEQQVSQGDEFTAAIGVEDLSEPLYAYEFTLSFADVVTVTGVEDVRFTEPITAGPVPEDGAVRFTAFIIPGGAEVGSDADGNLVIVEMEALESGTSELVLSRVQLTDSDGELIPVEGGESRVFLPLLARQHAP